MCMLLDFSLLGGVVVAFNSKSGQLMGPSGTLFPCGACDAHGSSIFYLKFLLSLSLVGAESGKLKKIPSSNVLEKVAMI